MTHKENYLDNKRKKGSNKKREKYEKNGKYNRKKIETNSTLVEKEIYRPNSVGKFTNKKGISILLD